MAEIVHEITLHAEQLWDSPWVFHALVALEEKRLPYRVRVETLPMAADRRAELQARAILAKVPVLVHGEVWLTESLAISEYLAEVFPFPRHPRLFPADPVERARARQIMCFLRTDLLALRAERSTASVFIEPVTTPLGEAARAQADELVRVARRVVAPGRDSMFAEWCIADADLALALQRLVANGDPVPEHLADYARAQWARPSVQLFLRRGSDARGAARVEP